MKNYEDGTVYSKYKKIKNQAGIERADAYITDEDKTKLSEYSGSIEEKDEQDIERAVSYIENDVKTINPTNYQHLVSGVNCNPKIASEQFRMDEEEYHKVKKEQLLPGQAPNRAFHIILSYKGTDVVSPELCHKLGVEFAKRVAGNEYRCLVATHINTDNVHNHILLSAYSLDREHPHKFLDRYNQYKYFRKIANELSVEYGLPIFLNDEKTKCPSWNEITKTEEGKSFVGQIRQDIGDLMDSCDSFGEVVDGMKQLGYEVTKNKNSITYQKGIYRVRDRRLGHEYTEEGFEETEKKIEDIKEKQKKREKQKPPVVDFSPIYISRYDPFGKRRGSLIRILLLVKAIIDKFGDSFLLAFNEGNETAETTRPEFKEKPLRIKLINDTIRTLQKYHIGSQEALDLTIRKLHQNRKELMIDLGEKQDIVENGEALRRDIDKFMKLYDEVKDLGVDPKDLETDYDERRVNENRAGLNPMKPKTKSRLYKAIHDSPYVLTKSFSELTEKEAREVIKTIRDEETDHLPETMVLRGTKRKKKEKVKREKKTYDLSLYSEDDKNKILELKDLLATYGLYGIADRLSAEKFKKDYDKSEREIKSISVKLTSFNESIRELYKTKKLCERMQLSSFSYGPLYTGSTEQLENGIDTIKKESTNVDYLRVIKKELDGLDPDLYVDNNTSELPDPVEYRILKDLEFIYPGILDDIHMENPREVDDICMGLKISGWIDDELKREEEREKKKNMENEGENERPDLRHLAEKMNDKKKPR